MNFLVDESSIRVEHIAWISEDAELTEYCRLVDATLDFIDQIVKIEPHENDNQLTQLRLGRVLI